MKKLLSLLSVLIISGTVVPTTIAASPYQKEENNNINYLQENNLEILNRNKRQNNNIAPELEISSGEIDKYFSDLYGVINFLQNRNNVNLITPQITGGYSSPNFFYLNENNNNNNNQYFVLPINIQNSRRISLVFNSEDLYLQGFIGHQTSNNQTLNVYYYFRDSTIRNISGVTSEVNINFDSTYTSLRGNSNSEILISWDSIIDSFNQVALYRENPDRFNSNPNRINQIKINFIRVILATSEALRFIEVRNNIIYNHYHNQTGIWDRIFDRFLKKWDSISRSALDYLISLGTLTGFLQLNDINIFSRTLSNYFHSCNKGRSIDSNNNEYCFISERKIYINNVEFGGYFYAEKKDRKKVVDLDINVTKALSLTGEIIKNEQDFKQNFYIVSLKDYKSNYKAFVKDDWFYDFKLNTSEFKINDWSYKLISSLEDKVGWAYINGKIYSNYRLYLDKENDLHMQIEIWMQGHANGLNNSWMWIWLKTGYFLVFNRISSN